MNKVPLLGKYYLNGILCVEIKYFWNSVLLFTEPKAIGLGLELSNEILNIFADQEAVKQGFKTSTAVKKYYKIEIQKLLICYFIDT